jgi:putative DNA methylase
MQSSLLPEYTLPIDSSFDVAFADRLARYETYNKHHYRPNTYLHKWWGRRCGSTFRAILKGFVENPEQSDYYTSRGLEGKVILDPMMGGGTTIHEAIRLGANVIGVDLDPIPVLQARASLTAMSLPRIRSAFGQFFDVLRDSIGPQFFTHCPTCQEQIPLWYSLYGLKRSCSCRDVLVVDSLVIRYRAGGTALGLCPCCGQLIAGDDHDCNEGVQPYIIEKSQQHCPDCHGIYQDRLEIPYYDRYELLVIAGYCHRHGLFLKNPDLFDWELLDQANKVRSRLGFTNESFEIQPGDKSTHLMRRGIINYLDLFSSRQLAFLEQAIESLPGEDPVIRLNLAMLLSTSLEFNTMLCGFKGVSTRRAGAVRHAFSHHGYSFPYTALELNPVYPRRASGTLLKLFHSRIDRGRRWAEAPRERVVGSKSTRFVVVDGERDSGQEVQNLANLFKGTQKFYLRQDSAATLSIADGLVDAVITDPPYFDSIQYGDLSAFFRVWLKKMLPEEAVWDYDQASAAVSSEQKVDNNQYVRLMSGIFQECARVLKPGKGRLIFTFHHWQPRAWAALSIALYQAQFRLVNRYVVHAEHPISVHINKMRALTHDAIMVFVPREYTGPRQWARPSVLMANDEQAKDSFRFTEICADCLGWILEQTDLDAKMIETYWFEQLRQTLIL